MRRLWIGFGVLAALLALGAAVSWGMDVVHRPAARQLEQAADAALAGNWQEAQRYADGAQSRWQRYRKFTASVADHTPMDDVEGLYAQLKVYAEEKDAAHFAAICLELARLSDAMADSHSPVWWNFL